MLPMSRWNGEMSCDGLEEGTRRRRAFQQRSQDNANTDLA